MSGALKSSQSSPVNRHLWLALLLVIFHLVSKITFHSPALLKQVLKVNFVYYAGLGAVKQQHFCRFLNECSYLALRSPYLSHFHPTLSPAPHNPLFYASWWDMQHNSTLDNHFYLPKLILKKKGCTLGFSRWKRHRNHKRKTIFQCPLTDLPIYRTLIL